MSKIRDKMLYTAVDELVSAALDLRTSLTTDSKDDADLSDGEYPNDRIEQLDDVLIAYFEARNAYLQEYEAPVSNGVIHWEDSEAQRAEVEAENARQNNLNGSC